MVGPGNLRAGALVLGILAKPLNCLLLRALAERPMRLAELRRAAGLPAQTTLRGHLAILRDLGVIEKLPTIQMPFSVANGLTAMGWDLLAVAECLEAWLQMAPDGGTSLETAGAKGIVKAFVDGWGSTIVRALVSRPMSLTELDSEIDQLSYPALERRLSSMRMAGLIEACEGRGPGTPYTVTDWARLGVAPLAAASGCEQAHLGDRAVPLTRPDIEAIFLLATPLVGLAPETSGECQLEVEVEVEADAADGGVGVRVSVERGRVVACEAKLMPAPGDYAIGSATSWFSAVRDGTASPLRFGPGNQVAVGMVTGLHRALSPR